MDQPIEKGQRWNIYCTKSTRELIGMIMKLPEEKRLHIKTWIEKGASVGKGGQK